MNQKWVGEKKLIEILEILATIISVIMFVAGSGLIVIEILKEIFGEQFPFNTPLDIVEGLVVGAILVITGVFIYQS